ncbi:MAG: molybdate ABC transporter permease subunit, partial [Candidatus Nanopelagicales bacterium]
MNKHRGRSTPWPILALAIIAVGFLLTPLVALFVEAPWSEVIGQLDDPVVRKALVLSLTTATVATVLSVVVGVPLAWVLAHGDWRGRRLLRALVVLPLVLPPVVGGVALLLAFGRRGLLGGPLYDWFNISIPFTP